MPYIKGHWPLIRAYFPLSRAHRALIKGYKPYTYRPCRAPQGPKGAYIRVENPEGLGPEGAYISLIVGPEGAL